jgi:hypothetical protein
MTKARLHKIWKSTNQTRKNINSNKKCLTHTNTFRNRRQFNLRHNTVKNLN